MAKPLVAVIGRPNVGKSTFFNKIAGRRISIVEDTPGVTRDRVYADCEWQRHAFTLIDTGGIDPKSEDPMLSRMRMQAEIAIETCDVILFFVDGREGLTADDALVADLLRRSSKPVVLVVNKIDSLAMVAHTYDFYALGLGEPIAISSANMMNFGDLLDELATHFPPPQIDEDAADKPIAIAVVGKPNVGKSSIVNRLLGQERVMVSDIPGTTRDAIDTEFIDHGDTFILIDTAGIRRKRAIERDSIERYSIVRSFAAIDRADVAILVIDAQDGITEQDTKIAGYIHDNGKAMVICVNKWDMLDKDTGTLEKYKLTVHDALKFADYAPVIFISALTGQRLHQVIATVLEVDAQTSRRITTGVLNDVLIDAQAENQPPSKGGRRLKIYYGTQQATKPPTFILFTNDPELMNFGYQRYLENHIRKAFDLTGTPIRIYVRARSSKED